MQPTSRVQTSAQHTRDCLSDWTSARLGWGRVPPLTHAPLDFPGLMFSPGALISSGPLFSLALDFPGLRPPDFFLALYFPWLLISPAFAPPGFFLALYFPWLLISPAFAPRIFFP